MRQIILAAGLAIVTASVTTAAWAQAASQGNRFAPIAAPAEPNAIPLLPAPVHGLEEQWVQSPTGRVVRNVVAPTLTPFLPDPATATGAAVVIAPGGAFLMLSIDNEGNDVARWLAAHGVAAFVLKYRLEATPADPAAFGAAIGARMSAVLPPPGATQAGANPPPPTVPPAALQDAEAAVRLVRQRASEWRVDPARVGFVGFSAGALTTLAVGLDAQRDARPDFIASIYGSMTAQPVSADSPPLFAAIAADDRLFATGDFGLVQSWRAAGRPVELHVYERGGHGFGMAKTGATSDLWIDQFYAWMTARGLLTKTAD